MAAETTIPRSAPNGDDGAGITDEDFVITYQDERVPCPACSGSGTYRVRIFGQYETYACLACNGRGDVTSYLAGLLERQGR